MCGSIGVVWRVVRLAGITLMGKTRARRCGFTRRARRVRRAGIATSGGVAAISLISCVSGMAWLLARCGGAFERVRCSDCYGVPDSGVVAIS